MIAIMASIDELTATAMYTPVAPKPVILANTYARGICMSQKAMIFRTVGV